MVDSKFIFRVLKQLEKYLLRKSDFQLGNDYDLILFVPPDRYTLGKFSLILSAQKLNNPTQKEGITELLNYFKDSLSQEDYSAISRVNIFHTAEPFVKNMKLVFWTRQEILEIRDYPLGGVNIEFAYLVKSLVLDKLIPNQAVNMEIINEKNESESISAGIIKIQENYNVVFYTGKGLREIYKQDMTVDEKQTAEQLKAKPEEYLIEHQYINKVSIDKILKII